MTALEHTKEQWQRVYESATEPTKSMAREHLEQLAKIQDAMEEQPKEKP